MDDMKLLSTEAEGVNEAIPEDQRKSLVNAQGRVGALLGLQDGADERAAGTGMYLCQPLYCMFSHVTDYVCSEPQLAICCSNDVPLNIFKKTTLTISWF